MDNSILTSTKKIVGINPDDPSFDIDIITHINSAFSILQQAGVGPANGFMITGPDELWTDYMPPSAGEQYNLVKTFVYLQVRLLFDPPAGSYHLTILMQQQLDQYLSRLNMMREATDWVDPEAA